MKNTAHAIWIIWCDVSSLKTNLSQHDESHEEGEEGYYQDEELPAVFTAEGGRIHVHHGRHQALHTHKLTGTRSKVYLYWHADLCCKHMIDSYYTCNNLRNQHFSIFVVHMLVSLDCPAPERRSWWRSSRPIEGRKASWTQHEDKLWMPNLDLTTGTILIKSRIRISLCGDFFFFF